MRYSMSRDKACLAYVAHIPLSFSRFELIFDKISFDFVGRNAFAADWQRFLIVNSCSRSSLVASEYKYPAFTSTNQMEQSRARG